MTILNILLQAKVPAPPHNGVNYHHTLALIMILGIIALFIFLALFSNILRDEVNDCAAFDQGVDDIRKTGKRLPKPENPFSLSRSQLAVWTVIISCSFIYMALCLGGDCTNVPINQTALILMGIGASVTTASSIMDKREIADNRPRHQNSPSQGFFIDILSDDNGISIHRFQNVVWTSIAMVLYLSKVYATKSGCDLPELSQTLLILTGISSTTYLFMKANENNPDVASVAAANNANPVTVNNPVPQPGVAPNAPLQAAPQPLQVPAPQLINNPVVPAAAPDPNALNGAV